MGDEGLAMTRKGSVVARYVCLVVFFCLAAMLGACGYQFRVAGQGPTIGGGAPVTVKADAPTLAIINFQNRSSEPNLETKYTAYTRHEFATASGAQVIAGTGGSDLVLKGQIISVVVPTIAFTLQQTLESRVTVYVSATVEKTGTKQIIWSQLVTASMEFFVTNDLQFNRVLQTRALEQAGRFVAQDLATRFLYHLESYGTAPAPAGSGSGITVPVPSGFTR
ncbi:MAG TPA: LPS assembly lipoprotein LptE [Nitrospiraceae bacterium]|nr:LPS assembly lipoprotein LptE [Nitrospiraceae bacterium]